ADQLDMDPTGGPVEREDAMSRKVLMPPVAAESARGAIDVLEVEGVISHVPRPMWTPVHSHARFFGVHDDIVPREVRQNRGHGRLIRPEMDELGKQRRKHQGLLVEVLFLGLGAGRTPGLVCRAARPSCPDAPCSAPTAPVTETAGIFS